MRGGHITRKTYSIIIALLSLIFIAGYAFVNNAFPVNDPVICPAAEDVISVSLTDSDGASVKVYDYDVFLQFICNSEPTRRTSVNDYPSAESYYFIEIITSSEEYRYYVYKENSAVYIESPYVGIYRADSYLLSLIEDSF